jgi:hypothetical protein
MTDIIYYVFYVEHGGPTVIAISNRFNGEDMMVKSHSLYCFVLYCIRVTIVIISQATQSKASHFNLDWFFDSI